MNITLSKKQQEVVDFTGGNLLVIAGAGSGKTRALTEKMKKDIKSLKPGEKVLAITFSNKASDELNERLNLISEFNTFEEFKRELKKIFNIYNIKDMINFINEKLNDIDIFGMKKEIINYIHNVNKLFVEVRDALNMDINDILKVETERILNGVKFLLFENPTDLREEDKQKLNVLNNILMNDNLFIYNAEILNNEEYIINYFFEGLRRLRRIRDYFNQLKPTREEKKKILKSLGFFVDLDYVEIWRLDEILNDIKERLNKLKIDRFLY